jgi:hypothetical protein
MLAQRWLPLPERAGGKARVIGTTVCDESRL